jgi:hypothetical protein
MRQTIRGRALGRTWGEHQRWLAQMADPVRSTRALLQDEEVAAEVAAARETDPTKKAALLERRDELARRGLEMERTMPAPMTHDPAAVRAAFNTKTADLTTRLARIKDVAANGGDASKLRPLAAQVQSEIALAAATARAEMAAWAAEVEADAARRYAEDPVGSAADESRRVSNELRLARLARSVTSRQAADGMLERARRLFALGNFAEAQVYATVAKDGGAFGADNLAGACQTALDQSNPARRQAVADRNEARTALAVFTREAMAHVAEVESGLAGAAAEMGDQDGAQAAGVRAARASIGSKVAGFIETIQGNPTGGEPALEGGL